LRVKSYACNILFGPLHWKRELERPGRNLEINIKNNLREFDCEDLLVTEEARSMSGCRENASIAKNISVDMKNCLPLKKDYAQERLRSRKTKLKKDYAQERLRSRQTTLKKDYAQERLRSRNLLFYWRK
jgi:hypothetical protein